MKKKTLIVLLCCTLIISSAALGSIAYLTSSSSVTNSFTVGNVYLKLDETKVNPSGEPVDEDGNVVDPSTGTPVRTETGNNYHLTPGKTYIKDPTVTIDKKSEDSYVRLLVTVTKAQELDTLCKAMTAANQQKYPHGLPQNHVAGYDAATWVCKAQTADQLNNTVTYEFRYFDTAANTDVVSTDGTNDLVLPALFSSISVPTEVSGAELATLSGFDIHVVAQAIQAEGFADADEAWAAFRPEETTTTTANAMNPDMQQDNANAGV